MTEVIEKPKVCKAREKCYVRLYIDSLSGSGITAADTDVFPNVFAAEIWVAKYGKDGVTYFPMTVHKSIARRSTPREPKVEIVRG